MTAADLVHRLLPVGALDRACAPGLDYLRANGHRPAAEVLDECLATTTGCAHVRWVAYQAWGDRAVAAANRGLREWVERAPANSNLRDYNTREVAAWLRAEIGGAS